MADLSSVLGGIDLSSVLSKAASDPAISATIASLVSGLRDSGQGQAKPPEPETKAEAEPAPAPSPTPKPDDAIAALLPILGMLGKAPEKGGSGGGRGRKGGDPRCALLLALKPYLSESRCAAIDRMVQVSKIGELIGNAPAGKREADQ